jgi:hypothetical protein
MFLVEDWREVGYTIHHPSSIDPRMKFRILAVTGVLVAAAAGMFIIGWQPKRATVGSKRNEMSKDAAILKAKFPLPPATIPNVKSNSERPQDQPVVEALALPMPAPAVQAPREATPTPKFALRSNAGTQVPAPAQSGKPQLQDPTARVALSAVGVDADAERYWYSAINDPTLPAHERQDLIEDLNETGLINPGHPTPEDLPLIVNRLTLIEQLAPQAMDEVNLAAFQEAYKDLVNLLVGMQKR